MVTFFKENSIQGSQSLKPLFQMFKPQRTEEEVIFEFLNLPLSNITPVGVFNMRQKKDFVSLDQKQAINTLVQHNPSAIDDFDNPLLQHASVLKMFLDRVRKGPNNPKKKFEHQRDAATDNALDRLTSIAEENKETILQVEETLRKKALRLKQKVGLGTDPEREQA